MNDYEVNFQSSLTDTPPLPDNLFARVQHGIRRRTEITRSSLAIAVSLVVCAAAIGYHGAVLSGHTPQAGTVTAVPSESRDNLNDDLKSIVSYINSSDIDSQMVAYSLADNSL